MSASYESARVHASGPSHGGSFSGHYEHDDAVSVMATRRVQIQAIPHSTMSSDTLVPRTSASVATDEAGDLLSHGLPSADNGLPQQQERDTDSGDNRKSTGLRAALASKFTPKKKTKDLSRLSVNTKRQQHQLESLISLSRASDVNEAAGPTVRGQPVGHPMSFQHVEHLSPTIIKPKLALINSPELYKSSTVQPKSNVKATAEKKSHFRVLKPASLLTKSSKQSLGDSDSASATEPTVRMVGGKPIGAPSGFQHVDHLSPEAYSTQQYQLLNHRQQQHEIVSVLSQTNVGGSSERPKTRGMTASNSSLPKIMYRGLPVSGPVTFEHVEHISPKDYQAQFLSAKLASATPSVAAVAAPGAERTIPTQQLPTAPNAAPATAAVADEKSRGTTARKHRTKKSMAHALGSKSTEETSNKAKAGISKARQISSPFNVQHDVHISVEDLDDIMQQVPDTWKPYINPMRSPQTAQHPTEDVAAAEDDPVQPRTPIYASMTNSGQRRSTSDSDNGLSGQLGQLGLSDDKRNSTNSSGADTPGWLPRIVSVCSPPETMPSIYHSKQRAASDLELDAHARRASADFQASRAPARHEGGLPTTPTSAPLGTQGLAQNGPPLFNMPESPVSGRSVATTTVTTTTTKTKATAVTYADNTVTSPAATTAAAAATTSKWIKRKSRIMPSTRFSIAPPALALAIAEHEAEEDEDVDVVASPATATAAAAAAVTGSGKMPSLGIDNGGLAAVQPGGRSVSQSSHLQTGGERDEKAGAESKSSRKRRENYGELEEYAEGESGNVYITTWAGVGKRPKGDYVAVKVVPKAAKARYRKLRTELKILRRIRSQHVVRFYEYFSIDDSVWIIYEFMSRGSITDLLVAYPEVRMPTVTIAYAMHEVLTALAYLHERHIVHCDVRSDNVLVDERGQVKLADFSSAVYLDADLTAAQKTSLGAIYWMAPELRHGSGYSGATDVWAAGALLYEMISGQPPYIEYPEIKVLELAQTNGLPRLEANDACDPRLVDLMRLCTVVAPAERLAASKLRKHESVAAPNAAQCAQLMVDFVLQVESLEEEDGSVESDDSG
ncbi:hypothetical protein GGI20_000077 [Coemansia sp. BCRC 34301]|nr:hypothetical protein GGI20_000077 [Coemansia sp. BCRC 34301]